MNRKNFLKVLNIVGWLFVLSLSFFQWLPYLWLNLGLVLWMPVKVGVDRGIVVDKADVQGAESFLTLAERSNSTLVSAIIQLGYLYEHTARPERALLTWSENKQFVSQNLLSQGKRLVNLGNYVSAEHFYNLGLLIIPGWGDAYCELARLYVLTDNMDLALSAYYEATASPTLSESYLPYCNYEFGRLLAERGMWEDASERLKIAANTVNLSRYIAIDILIEYGIALYQVTGSVELVQEQFEKVDSLGLSNGIWLLVRLGEFGARIKEDVIVKYWSTAIAERWPTSAWSEILMGEYYFRQDDISRATEVLQLAISKDPKNADGHYWLARCYVAQEQYESALEHASFAANKKPSLRLHWLLLGDIYLLLEQNDKAGQAYNRMLELDPQDRLALQRLKQIEGK